MVALAAAGSSLLLTSLAMRPLRGLFRSSAVTERHSLIGRVCTVTSASLASGSGQAEVGDGGSGVLLNVRTRYGHELKLGHQAVIFDYDAREDVFHIAPAAFVEQARSKAEATVVAGEGHISPPPGRVPGPSQGN